MIQREKIIKEFCKYVERYDDSNDKIILKKEHTLRVAELCEKIGELLGLNQADKDLAWTIGMLHDVGRFEQLRRYGTFEDGKSIDHAKLGVAMLFEQGLIRNYVEDTEQDEVIKMAILSHNVFALPEHLEKRTKMFCDLIRDADKIDIFKVNVEISMEVIYGFTTDELKKSMISKEVMEGFYEHHAILHQLKKAPIDYLIGHISMAFELVFPCSIIMAKEQGYLQKMLDFQSENEETKKQFILIRKEMELQ